jgi:hypothetical protein
MSATDNFGNKWQAVYYGSANEKAVQYSEFHKAVFNKLGRITYRVSACNSQGFCGNYARNAPLLLTDAAFVSPVPASHKATACLDLPKVVEESSNFALSWCLSEANNVQSYELLGELAGTIVSGNQASFSTTSQGLLSVIRPALPAGREYCYKTQVTYNDGSKSAYSDTQCLTVGSVVFEAPTDMIERATGNGENNFDLGWSAVDNADHYLLERQGDLGTWHAVDCVVNNLTIDNKPLIGCNLALTIADLVPELNRMVYRVSACNSNNMCGNYSRHNFELTDISPILFIHTELLGTPTLKTNNGGVQ